MSQAYRDLVEGLPARSAPGPNNFPADPRKAAAWVAALPRANQAATGDMLEKALVDLRGCKLAGGARLAVLEVLRPMLLEIMQALHRQCQGTPIPLPAPKARLFERLQRLEAELALGYRLAVVELCAPAGAVPFLRGGVVAQCLERATYHAVRNLDHAYFIYRQPPEGAWLQLHSLYAFASSAKLQDKSVDEPHAAQSLSVAALFGAALLIAVSNPYRFTQRDQAELARLGPALGRLLQIRQSRASEDDLAVPTSADRGPGYIASEREDDAEARLWIDLSRMKAHAEEAVSGASGQTARMRMPEGKPIDLPRELLVRMRDGWGRSQARRTQRLAARHHLDTAIGISGLHFHLAGLVDFETFLRQAGEADEGGIQAGQQRAVWAHAAVDAGRIPLQSAEVVDQSLGGYQLRWPAEEAVKARVDELIGLSVPAEGEERQWLLGVIRWLRYDADGAVDAGVQLLSRRVRPVALRHVESEEGGRLPLRGIEYLPVSGDREGDLHFSAAGMIEPGTQEIEVLRVPDINDLDQPVSLREVADAPSVAENAGDYILLVARRREAV